MSSLSSLREFPRSLAITPQVDCLFTQGSHAIPNYFDSFSHLAKGGCPCYKTPPPPCSRGLFAHLLSWQRHRLILSWRDLATFILVIPRGFAPNSCSTTWTWLCGLDFVIPLRIAPSTCCTTRAWLCGLALRIMDRRLFGLQATVCILSARS